MEDFRMAKLMEARRMGSATTSGVQELASALARQAETAGERLQALASAFREALPSDGGGALVSEGLAAARSYLGERDVREIGREVTDLVRRYPVPTMLLGAGIGYLIARRASRSAPHGNGSGMWLKDVMTRHVETVGPDSPLKEAAAKMADLDVGAIPVCDGDQLVGMLTDRDIAVRGVARGADPSTPVREIMSTTIRYGFEDEPLDRAVETMKKRKIRRLPILDRERRLMGIVSLGDLAVDADPGRAAEVLQRVSEPARPAR
jgi:CBS domain-containing protein